MFEFLLLIYLVEGQYTVYESFQTKESCFEKKATVQRALIQADSKMKLACAKRKLNIITHNMEKS